MEFSEYYFTEVIIKPDRWFKYATLKDVIDLVKKNKILPLDEFKFEIEPDKYLDIKDVMRLGGLYDEKRQWHINKDRKVAMFGNYTMKDWFNFLTDIAENGLREPILLSKDESKIIEGNHRVQALYQLGYNKVPVILERK